MTAEIISLRRKVTETEIAASIEAIKRSPAFRRAEAKYESHIVAMIGYRGPVPRAFGDNSGAWPVFFASTSVRDVQAYLKRPDGEQPFHELAVLGWTYCPTEAHGKRLRAALDATLVGDDEDRNLRHKWRDILGIGESADMIWGRLLEAAVLRIVERGETIDVYGPEERSMRVIAAMRKDMFR